MASPSTQPGPSWGLRFRIVRGVFETEFAVLLMAALGGLLWSVAELVLR